MKRKLIAVIVTVMMLIASTTVFAAPPGGGPRPGGFNEPPRPRAHRFEARSFAPRPMPPQRVETPGHIEAPRPEPPRPVPPQENYTQSSYYENGSSDVVNAINTVPVVVNALQSIFGMFGGSYQATPGVVSTQAPEPVQAAEQPVQ